MRKNLIISLRTLAHDILNLEADQDLGTLRQKTEKIYEKLVILDYLNKNIDSLEDQTTKRPVQEVQPSNFNAMSEDLAKEEIEEVNVPVVDKENEPEKFQSAQEDMDQGILAMDNEKNNEDDNIHDEAKSLEDLFEPTFDSIKEDFSQKDEFKDTISLDETEKLFETKKTETKSVSLNDKLLGKKIQVGLNDRIAFVNILFNYNQADFNKILDELNAFESEIEAKNYIQNSIKIKYDWSGKEDVEERFLLLVERKFL